MYQKPQLTGFLIFLFSALYYLSFCRYGINLWDEGGIYYGGIRYMEGQSAINDFVGYPPGRYYLVQAVYQLFGQDMIYVRSVIAILTAVFPLITFHISRRIMPQFFAISAVLLSLSAPAVYYQRFYGFVFLFNALALMIYLENRRNVRGFAWLIVGGLLAFFLKSEVTLFLIPLYCFLFWGELGLKGKVTVVVLSLLSFYLFFFQFRYGEQFLFHILNELTLWGNSFPSLFEGYQGRQFGFYAFFENLLFYIPFITGCITFIIAIRSRENRELLLLLSYLQIAAMSLAVTRAGFDNLIRCLPLFFITASFVSYHLIEKLKKLELKAMAEIAFSAVLVIYLAVFNLENGFYTGSIGAIADGEVVVKSGKARSLKVRGKDRDTIIDMTNLIHTESSSGSAIFLAPLNPIFYYLSDRKNRTSYDWVLPSTFKNKGEEGKLVAELIEGKPELIIIVDIEIDNRPERSLKVYAPLLYELIVENYILFNSVYHFQFWKPKR